jgi:hypothetical protein
VSRLKTKVGRFANNGAYWVVENVSIEGGDKVGEGKHEIEGEHLNIGIHGDKQKNRQMEISKTSIDKVPEASTSRLDLRKGVEQLSREPWKEPRS